MGCGVLLGGWLLGPSLVGSPPAARLSQAYRAKIVSTLGSWVGAANTRGDAGHGSEEEAAAAEEAAALYLQLVRALEAWKGDMVKKVAGCLGVQRLMQKGKAELVLNPQIYGMGRSPLSAIIALFLVLPNELALYVDGRLSNDKDGKPLAPSDTAFLINGVDACAPSRRPADTVDAPAHHLLTSCSPPTQYPRRRPCRRIYTLQAPHPHHRPCRRIRTLFTADCAPPGAQANSPSSVAMNVSSPRAAA